MKTKPILQIASIVFIGSYSYSVVPNQAPLIDNFTNTNTGLRNLPDESNPVMHRTLLNDSFFIGSATNNPKLNIINNRIITRRNAAELNGASFVMKYKFAWPLYVNQNSNINFHFDSVKKPFILELNINKSLGLSNVLSISCTPFQNHYSIPISSLRDGAENVYGVDIKLFANPNASGSLAILGSIEFGAEPVLEPIPALPIDQGYFTFPKTYIGNSSSIEVVYTEEGVKLATDDKKIDLTKVLRIYLDENMIDLDLEKFADHLEQSRKVYSSNVLSEKTLRSAMDLKSNNIRARKILSKKEYDRLQHSTVMILWSVIPHQKDKKTTNEIYSELVGLMRDEQTKQLYPFNFDIGEDISVLMNYPSNE